MSTKYKMFSVPMIKPTFDFQTVKTRNLFKKNIAISSRVLIQTILMSGVVFYHVIFFSFSKEQWILVVDFLNNCDLHVTDLMAWKIKVIR